MVGYGACTHGCSLSEAMSEPASYEMACADRSRCDNDAACGNSFFPFARCLGLPKPLAPTGCFVSREINWWIHEIFLRFTVKASPIPNAIFRNLSGGVDSYKIPLIQMGPYKLQNNSLRMHNSVASSYSWHKIAICLYWWCDQDKSTQAKLCCCFSTHTAGAYMCRLSCHPRHAVTNSCQKYLQEMLQSRYYTQLVSLG